MSSNRSAACLPASTLRPIHPWSIQTPTWRLKILLAAAAALLLGSCMDGSRQRCATTSGLNSDLTPAELSLEAGACARRGDLRAASLRYGLAMAFSTYDNQRAGDRDPPGFAGTRMMLPQLILRSQLEPAGIAALLEDFKAATEPGERRNEFCLLLQRVGPPIYPVNYTVDERMRVVRPKSSNTDSPAEISSASRPGFDPRTAWRTVLTRVVECPPA
jgi:hypothetical protein